MMRRFIYGALLMLAAGPVLAQTDCTAVVAATLEEMRLGAAGQWSAAEEAAARAAAGSACLKADSGRYGSSVVVESIDVARTEGGEGGEGGSSNTTDAQESDGGESSGIRFTPMTGAPGQKPYERSRSSDK